MIPVRSTCTDHRFFCRAGGRSRPDDLKTALTVLFSSQLILKFTEGGNGFITEKTIYFSKDLEWAQHFEGVCGESGSFRPRSSSPPRRFAPAAFRPRSFRPWSFRPWSIRPKKKYQPILLKSM